MTDHIYWILLGTLLGPCRIQAINITFYTSKGAKSIFYENIPSKCHFIFNDLMAIGVLDIRKLETDTCLMAYIDFDCSLGFFKRDRHLFDIPSQKIIGELILDYPQSIFWSFRPCNEDEGGNQLNVGLLWGDHPRTPENYTKVCSCFNVPTHVTDYDWSLYNYGNELLAYYDKDCSEKNWKAEFIPAGVSETSKFISYLSKDDTSTNTQYKIQSFGPIYDSNYFHESCLWNFGLNSYLLDLEVFEHFNSTNYQELEQKTYQTDANTTMSSKISFFRNTRFDGFLFERDIAKDCSNLPMLHEAQYNSEDILSIKTDTCVMIYTDYDCEGLSYKMLKESSNLVQTWEGTVTGPATLAKLYETIPNFHWTTRSFQNCPENLGLKVDIILFQTNVIVIKNPIVLEKFIDVCFCQNIPKYIRNLGKWSINNYDSSMIAYFEPDCSSNLIDPIWVPAGHSSYSLGLGSFVQLDESSGIRNSIQSYRPDPRDENFKSNCLNLFATIMKVDIFEFQNASTAEIIYNNVGITSKNSFRNDGPAQISQEYSASKSVSETYRMELGSSLSDMGSVQVDSSFDVEARKGVSNSETISSSVTNEAGVSVSAGGNFFGIGMDIKGSYSKTKSAGESSTESNFVNAGFRESLRKAYQNIGTSTLTSGQIITIEKSREFSISQIFDIPACTEQVVNAFIRVVKKKGIDFQVLIKVGGYLGTQEMLADEVHKFLSNDLKYVADYDDNTVLALASGTMEAEYGVMSVISAEGSTIHECVVKNDVNRCPICEDCSPTQQ